MIVFNVQSSRPHASNLFSTLNEYFTVPHVLTSDPARWRIHSPYALTLNGLERRI